MGGTRMDKVGHGLDPLDRLRWRKRDAHLGTLQRCGVGTIDRRESSTVQATSQRSPEREGTTAPVPTKAPAGIGVEELHVIVRSPITRVLDKDQTVGTNAEMTVAQTRDQRRITHGETAGAIIHEDEIVACTVPLAEPEIHDGGSNIALQGRAVLRFTDQHFLTAEGDTKALTDRCFG